MNKFKKILMIVCTLVIFFFVVKPEIVSAKTGDPATVEMQFNVYYDIKYMDSNIATGDFESVTVTIPMKKGEVWERNTIFEKAVKYAEPALKEKTGEKHTVIDLVAAPNDQRYISYVGYRTNRYNSLYLDNKYPNLSVEFEAGSSSDEYSFTVNVLANKGNKLNGWVKYTDSARYYENGKFRTGLKKVGQTTYLFNTFGGKQTGWHNINGHDMYFNEQNGGLWTGKRKIGDTTYLFNSQGEKLYGWHRLNNNDYYFNEDNGGMLTGKRTIGETTYLFHNDGYKIKGWFVDNYGYKYYFDPNYGGGLVTGLRKVENAHYFFSTPYSGNAGSSFIGSAVKDSKMTINGQNWYFSQTSIGKKVN